MQSTRDDATIDVDEIKRLIDFDISKFARVVVDSGLSNIIKSFSIMSMERRIELMLRSFVLAKFDPNKPEDTIESRLRLLEKVNLNNKSLLKTSKELLALISFIRAYLNLLMNNKQECKKLLTNILSDSGLQSIHYKCLFIRSLLWLETKNYVNADKDFKEFFKLFQALSEDQQKIERIYHANALVFAASVNERLNKLSKAHNLLMLYVNLYMTDANPKVVKYILETIIQIHLLVYTTKDRSKCLNIDEYIMHYIKMQNYNHHAYQWLSKIITADQTSLNECFIKILDQTFAPYIINNSLSELTLINKSVNLIKKTANTALSYLPYLARNQAMIATHRIPEQELLVNFSLYKAKALYLAGKSNDHIIAQFNLLAENYSIIQLYLRTLYYFQIGYYSAALTELNIYFGTPLYDVARFTKVSELLGHDAVTNIDIAINIMKVSRRVTTNSEDHTQLLQKIKEAALHESILAKYYLAIYYKALDQQDIARTYVENIYKDKNKDLLFIMNCKLNNPEKCLHEFIITNISKISESEKTANTVAVTTTPTLTTSTPVELPIQVIEQKIIPPVLLDTVVAQPISLDTLGHTISNQPRVHLTRRQKVRLDKERRENQKQLNRSANDIDMDDNQPAEVIEYDSSLTLTSSTLKQEVAEELIAENNQKTQEDMKEDQSPAQIDHWKNILEQLQEKDHLSGKQEIHIIPFKELNTPERVIHEKLLLIKEKIIDRFVKPDNAHYETKSEADLALAASKPLLVGSIVPYLLLSNVVKRKHLHKVNVKISDIDLIINTPLNEFKEGVDNYNKSLMEDLFKDIQFNDGPSKQLTQRKLRTIKSLNDHVPYLQLLTSKIPNNCIDRLLRSEIDQFKNMLHQHTLFALSFDNTVLLKEQLNDYKLKTTASLNYMNSKVDLLTQLMNQSANQNKIETVEIQRLKSQLAKDLKYLGLVQQHYSNISRIITVIERDIDSLREIDAIKILKKHPDYIHVFKKGGCITLSFNSKGPTQLRTIDVVSIDQFNQTILDQRDSPLSKIFIDPYEFKIIGNRDSFEDIYHRVLRYNSSTTFKHDFKRKIRFIRLMYKLQDVNFVFDKDTYRSLVDESTGFTQYLAALMIASQTATNDEESKKLKKLAENAHFTLQNQIQKTIATCGLETTISLFAKYNLLPQIQLENTSKNVTKIQQLLKLIKLEPIDYEDDIEFYNTYLQSIVEYIDQHTDIDVDSLINTLTPNIIKLLDGMNMSSNPNCKKSCQLLIAALMIGGASAKISELLKDKQVASNKQISLTQTPMNQFQKPPVNGNQQQVSQVMISHITSTSIPNDRLK